MQTRQLKAQKSWYLSHGLNESLRPQGIVFGTSALGVPRTVSLQMEAGFSLGMIPIIQNSSVLPLSRPQHVHCLRKGDNACLLSNESPSVFPQRSTRIYFAWEKSHLAQYLIRSESHAYYYVDVDAQR